VIGEVKWKGIGCAISTAAASKLSVWLKGRRLEEVNKMSEEELTKNGIGFEVNPGREKCLTLPARVIRRVLGLAEKG
jgi:nitrogen fixation NifU-like protein